MTSVSFSDNITAFNNFITIMTNVMNKTKNIGYSNTKNLTTISGIVNVEALGILGQPVALKSDLNGKANTSHTHVLNDVAELYEEEEQFIEEEDDGEGNVTNVTKTRTVTKSKPLTDILENKASINHNHDGKSDIHFGEKWNNCQETTKN